MLTRYISFFLLLTVGLLGACQHTGHADSSAAAYENINATTFAAKMQDENVIVLDVRTPQETAKGKIAGAIEINLNAPNFEQKLAQLDKDKTYLVYCRSGRRSGIACRTMKTQGFRECYNLVGGYNSWPK